ncbi:SDR family oxidoreductase [Trinickia fusca]|uniref:SDR family oxidoreductase n=1 Tax=Trinickia fusca TaxID=2419777 RepID=A0A494XNN1_9BURK|nr:SDR family oxidoreductase [Trinickia fusca]RKP52238.1 SDR family oxidoreductase [Trinickia fusca]
MSKVALVTGAAKRTGRSIAEYFGRKGYDVAVHYGTSQADAHEVTSAIEAMGQRAIALHADLANADDLRRLVDATYEQLGRLDVLVNNASFFAQDHFPDFSEARLDLALAVNYRAPILLTKAYYERARALGTQGVVINVVDQKVKGNFHRDHFCYTVGKVGLGNLTSMLATSTHPVLRVNAVYPGLMLPSDDQTEEDFLYACQRSTPLGRIAAPEDVAEAIELLTGPAYNGVDFVVDGGQNLWRVDQDVLYEHRAPRDEAGPATH